MSEQRPRILIVEDDDSEREALARVLRLEKYQVIAARNPGLGDVALEGLYASAE